MSADWERLVELDAWQVLPEDLPTVYAHRARGVVDVADYRLTPDEARRLAAHLVEAAAIAEGRVQP